MLAGADGPYDMNAVFMLERHRRGIHALSLGDHRAAKRITSHDSTPGPQEHQRQGSVSRFGHNRASLWRQERRDCRELCPRFEKILEERGYAADLVPQGVPDPPHNPNPPY
jgi:hypothetical protein